MQLLRKILVLFFTALTLILLISLKGALFVQLSFLFNALVLFIIFIYHIFYEKKFSPFLSSFIVFNYLFLFLAPLIQISSFYQQFKPKFPQYFPYSDAAAIYANFLIILFNLSFFIFYIFQKKNFKPLQIKQYNLVKKVRSITILLLLILSLLIMIYTFPVVLDEIIKPYWMESKLSKMYTLIINKTILVIPFAGVILSKYYLDNHPKKTNNYYIIIIILLLFLAILLWFKNPLTEKRNALGPLYITLIYLFRPKWLNSNTKLLSFLFFSMVIAFPLVAIITHSAFTLTQIIKNPALLLTTFHQDELVEVFHSLHYDAFGNIMATVDYVSQKGLSWGKQLLGTIVFYIPRSIWADKPLGTGQLIGNYLISKYHFFFNNLSNPLVSEGYINFGIAGVILFAFLLAYFLKKMFSWFYGNHPIKKILAFYFAIHLIFLLRGDLLNGVAYFVGVSIALLVVPYILEQISLLIYFKSKK